MEQEHILNTHIDTLNEWYENAEKTTPRIGDTYISKFPSGDGYEFGIVDSDGIPKGMLSDTRVLARSEKPTPAWHDAVAVLAHKYGDYGLTPREVYVRLDGDRWESPSYYARPSALLDVTPLIEQKVTDEMVKRLENHFLDSANMALPTGLARTMLTAALGLDPA